MTIRNFSIEYDAINSKNIFTNGDTVNGRISIEVSKETKIQALVFRAQGKARVCWHEQHGENNHVVYTSKEKYYDVTHHILRETRQNGTEVVGPGRHVFPFSFKIPDGKIPPSFKSSVGKIVHKLKAELKQSLRLTKKAKTHFTFVPKADMEIPGLLDPQNASKDKTISVFGSGTVAINVHTQRLGYWQGEALQVTVQINNQSSRGVKPKFILYRKKSYFAQGHRRIDTKEILKEKNELVPKYSNKTVTKVIMIPEELPPSIMSCSIIRLEYKLKIHLDIKCAKDPEIKLPIVVLPDLSNTAVKKQPTKCKEYEDSTQPSQSSALHHPAAPSSEEPPPYGAHAMYPTFTQSDLHGTRF